MATPLNNTGLTTVTDRQAAGPIPDTSPPNGGTVGGGGGGPLNNPMTTLGDMIYEPASLIPARLAGNATTRRQYLGQRGTGSASAAPVWTSGPNFNVKDFGAIGDGATDDTAAINLARAAAVAAGGGTLYFPGGTYLTTGITAVTTVPIGLVGDGLGVSTIANTHATNPTASATGFGVTIRDLKFTTTVNRANGNPILTFDGSGNNPLVYFSNIQIRANGDCVLNYRTLFSIENSSIKALAQGGYALKSKGGLTATGTAFFTIGGQSPAVWVQGQDVTSIAIANCGISGFGPARSQIPTSIASDGSKWTITTPAAHSHAVGDWIVISGVTPSAYNGYWRIATVPSATTFTITTGVNPGAATITFTAGSFVVGQRYQIATLGSTTFTSIGAPINVVGTRFIATGVGSGSGTASGVVYSVPCAMLVDNALGSVNESQIVGTQFGASGYPKDAISAGLYVDGRQGDGTIEGWILGDSYVDLGRLGVLLCGKGTSGGTTTSRWEINSVHIKGNNGNGDSTMLGQVWVEQSPAVTLIGVKCTQGDKDAAAIALLVYSNGSAPFCDGLVVQGCELGICANWSGVSSANVAKYGAYFDGKINYFTFVGNVVWGSTAPTFLANTPFLAASTVIKSFDNAFFTGTTWPALAVYQAWFTKDGSGTVRRTANQTLGTSGTEYAVSWSSVEDHDDAGMWAGGAPTRLTVQAGQRLLRLTATAVFDTNGVDDRRIRIQDNNGKNWGRSAFDAGASTFAAGTVDTGWVDVVAQGITYFELYVTQWSGGSLDLIGAAQGETRMSYEAKEAVGY